VAQDEDHDGLDREAEGDEGYLHGFFKVEISLMGILFE
jgi:hypothetical protein